MLSNQGFLITTRSSFRVLYTFAFTFYCIICLLSCVWVYYWSISV